MCSITNYTVEDRHAFVFNKPAGAPSGRGFVGALDALANGSALAAVGDWAGASFG